MREHTEALRTRYGRGYTFSEQLDEVCAAHDEAFANWWYTHPAAFLLHIDDALVLPGVLASAARRRVTAA